MSEPAAKQRPMINLDEFERRLGRPTPPTRSGDDPLAELARLVGGTEDRFKSMFQARPASPANPPLDPRVAHRDHVDRLAPPPSPADSRSRPLGGDFAAIEAGLRGSIAPEYYTNGADADYAGADYPDANVEDDDWLDAPYEPAAPAARPVEAPRSRLPLYATAAIIVVGIAGIGTTFALKRTPAAPREIAMIKAAPGPIKVQASGTADADQNQDASILDKSPQPQPTAAVNRTEQPEDLAGTARTADGQAPQSTATTATPPTAAPNNAVVVPVPPPPVTDSNDGQDSGLSGLIEPKKVKTVSIHPDGTSGANDSIAQQEFPPIAPPTMVAPASVNSTPAPNDSASATPPAAPETDQNSVAPSANDTTAPEEHRAVGKPKSPPKPERVAEADTDNGDANDAAAPSSAGGAFAVQLAAPTSESQARQVMTKLQRQFGSLLAGHHLKYHVARVADKSVYRVRVGGMSHEAATTLCQKLQAKGGTCFVARG